MASPSLQIQHKVLLSIHTAPIETILREKIGAGESDLERRQIISQHNSYPTPLLPPFENNSSSLNLQLPRPCRHIIYIRQLKNVSVRYHLQNLAVEKIQI